MALGWKKERETEKKPYRHHRNPRDGQKYMKVGERRREVSETVSANAMMPEAEYVARVWVAFVFDGPQRWRACSSDSSRARVWLAHCNDIHQHSSSLRITKTGHVLIHTGIQILLLVAQQRVPCHTHDKILPVQSAQFCDSLQA